MKADGVYNKARPQHLELCALLFSNSVWVLLSPAELSTIMSCETGPMVSLSLSEKTRKPNHLQM